LKFKQINIAILILLSVHLLSAQYQSSILHYNENNRLVYHSDEDGNRIPDFSYAGYKNGESDIPNVPVVFTISPENGDNTDNIQSAIDMVSVMSPDENGHRGTLLLEPGTYPVSQTIFIKSSGVVVRGSGQDSTIIYATGTDRRPVIVAGSGIWNGWNNRVSGSIIDITSEYIPVGSRTIEVEKISPFSIGDNIIIKHPSTDKWLAAVDYGSTHGDVPWKPGEIDMVFNRFITKIEGNKIQFDIPLTHDLDRSLSQSFIWKYTRSSIITECGIENLTIDIETAGEFDNDHAEAGVKFIGMEDSWVKDVTTMHFAEAGIWLNQSTRVTVLNSKAIEPHAVIEGGRRYNFYVGDVCNNVLFKGCHGSEGRHTFVSNGAASVAGAVFTQCTSTGDYTASESHRRWGSGILWDNITWSETNTDRILGMYNRGSWGTGHGWTGTNQVAWNISAPENYIVIQKPPIGQNYAIGCDANVTNIGPFNPHPAGWIEGTGEEMAIESLYEAQLNDRITFGISPDAPGKLKPVEYVYKDSEKYVIMEWFDIAIDEDHYILERSSDGGMTWNHLAQLEANTQTYTDSELAQNNYHYRLQAINEIGASAYSNIAQALGNSSGDMKNITFRVDLKYIEDMHDGGDVWVSFGAWESWHTMTDIDNDNIFVVTVPILELTELEYFFAYQTGPDPNSDYSEESVDADCSNPEGYRTLLVEKEDKILPAVVFGGCHEALPEGTDITDLEGTIIKGSNDDFPWEGATAGAGSPDGERIPNLIDNDVTTKYLVRAVQSWIDIEVPEPTLVTGYTITSANDAPERDPRSWQFCGWDESSEEWIILHTVENNPSWPDFLTPKSWTFENDKWFKAYLLNISAINFDSQDLMQIAELEIWGKLESDVAIENPSVVASEFELSQNYPNPFNPTTNISYSIPSDSKVNLGIYNMQGQLIRNLVQKNQSAGKYNIEWNATNTFGTPMASGIYFYNLTIESKGEKKVKTRKMVLMK